MTTQSSGLMNGHSRRKTTEGDDASPEPMGLLKVGFALKESSGNAGRSSRRQAVARCAKIEKLHCKRLTSTPG
ncbi:hypothetical protein VOM14_15655 [Paraburkholderia sp. MPAMCS5]|uniref:hypothetical protein n=1 Tax=Paraburkholderia sp. MPAMCS5 TaxID=3112563 RepID=UPI002E17F920|nr:hypothetical protein [Paraburkholderia sp. MPAMCS5]